MNLTEVVNDPDIAEHFTILRSSGGFFGPGGWVEPPPQSISMYGVISQASMPELESLPEADRVHDTVVINCELPMFITRVANTGTMGTPGAGTSDIVIYQGEKYRIMKVSNYAARGYWWAIATRMLGA